MTKKEIIDKDIKLTKDYVIKVAKACRLLYELNRQFEVDYDLKFEEELQKIIVSIDKFKEEYNENKVKTDKEIAEINDKLIEIQTSIDTMYVELTNRLEEFKGEVNERFDYFEEKLKTLKELIDSTKEDLIELFRKELSIEIKTITETFNDKVDTLKTDLEKEITDLSDKTDNTIELLDDTLRELIKTVSEEDNATFNKKLAEEKDRVDLELDSIKSDAETAKEELNKRIDEEVETINTTISDKDTELNKRIDEEVETINTTIDTNKDELIKLINDANLTIDTNKDEFDKKLVEEVKKLNKTIDEEVDTLNKTITATDETINKRIDKEVDTLNKTIDANDTATNKKIDIVDTNINKRIDEEVRTLNKTIDTNDTTVNKRIDSEVKTIGDTIYEIRNEIRTGNNALTDYVDASIKSLRLESSEYTDKMFNITTSALNKSIDTWTLMLESAKKELKADYDGQISTANVKIADNENEIKVIYGKLDKINTTVSILDNINERITKLINENNKETIPGIVEKLFLECEKVFKKELMEEVTKTLNSFSKDLDAEIRTIKGADELNSRLKSIFELANAIGNDPNFSSTVASDILAIKVELNKQLNDHATNRYIHITDSERDAWNAKLSSIDETRIVKECKQYTEDRLNGLLDDPLMPILDTLKALSKALGDDPNFSKTVLDAIAKVQTNLDKHVDNDEIHTSRAERESTNKQLLLLNSSIETLRVLLDTNIVDVYAKLSALKGSTVKFGENVSVKYTLDVIATMLDTHTKIMDYVDSTVRPSLAKLEKHAEDLTIHVTATDKTNWNKNTSDISDMNKTFTEDIKKLTQSVSDNYKAITSEYKEAISTANKDLKRELLDEISRIDTSITDIISKVNDNANSILKLDNSTAAKIEAVNSSITEITKTISSIDDELHEHVLNTKIHITDDERTKWNGKLDSADFDKEIESISGDITKLKEDIVSINKSINTNSEGIKANKELVEKVSKDLTEYIKSNDEAVSAAAKSATDTKTSLDNYIKSNDEAVSKNSEDIEELTDDFDKYKDKLEDVTMKTDGNKSDILAYATLFTSYKESNDKLVNSNKESIEKVETDLKNHIDDKVAHLTEEDRKNLGNYKLETAKALDMILKGLVEATSNIDIASGTIEISYEKLSENIEQYKKDNDISTGSETDEDNEPS